MLDCDGAPKPTHWSFTYEAGRGPVFWEDGPGCRLWYVGRDYLKAYDEAAPVPRHGDQWQQRGSSRPYMKQEGSES
jgi:hypothetical protein